MKRFEVLKNEILDLMGDELRVTNDTHKLINNVIALSNPKIRVYYNFSIISFEYLLKNTTTEEFDMVLKNLEQEKVYIIKDLEELKEYLQYLQEEEEYQLYKDIVKNIIKINDNLYIFEAI